MASILVCGGGNAAQVSASLFAPRNKVYAISLYADEAERWSKAVAEAGHMECTLVGTDGKNKVIQGTPDKITNDPSVVADCDVVLFTVPSSFHDQYFEALAPHVKDGTIFAVMPARSGCDFLFQKIMGAKAKKLGLMAFETLPWACRFNEWGKTSTVLGIKETIGAAVQPPEGMTALEAMLKVQGVLGVHPMIVEYPNIMSISLGNPGQVVHPGITYSRWHAWDGAPLKEKPLFYQGADDFTQEVLMGISDDIQVICKALTAIDPHFDTSMVKTIYGWYMASYGTQCTDVSSLQAAMRTNPGYAGLTHPMKGDAEAGYTPDFHYRYLEEDVPTGLCFTKGVADLLEVHTPTIDKVVQWAQEKLGKEFLVNGKMAGKDIGYTRAPQAQGFATKEALLKFLGVGHGKAVHKIVFLRHGESDWNVKNIFTGWHDVDLSETGKKEAVEAGKMLKDAHFKFDVVFTSVLKRAIKTAWTACSESDNYSMPMIQSWRLNERHYGALQGLNKAETAAKHGEEQVKIWRRSYDIPPPAIAQADARHPSNDPLYASVPQDALPGAESLKLTVDRVLPFWFDTIAPVVLAGKSVLVAAHGNSLRAICKYLEGMSEAEVLDFNIPTAVPLVYELDSKLKFVRKYYLMDPEEVAKKVAAVANQGKAK